MLRRTHLAFGLLLALTSAARAQTDTLVKARPDFQNQLYLAAPTNAPGTALAQPASVALASGSLGDATNAASPAPNDGVIRLAQSLVGAAFTAPPASLAVPMILTQPADTFVNIGSNAALTVLVSSDSPASYQWFRNGILLAGATNLTLVLNNPQFTNSGSFFVTISNASGYTTSLVASFAAASKAWAGGGDGQSWNDAANWTGGTLPTASDSIFIGSSGAGITNVPALTLNNLICQRALSLNNSLTVTGSVDATSSLYLAPGISLTVSGTNAMFVGEGSTIANQASFYAQQGGLISLMGLTNYNSRADANNTLHASGLGSVLDLPALQTVTGPVAQVSYLTIQALQGGVVKLTNVQTMTVNYVYGGASSIGEHGIRIFADGTGTNSRFNHPYGVAVDSTGIVYAADYSNYTLRKMTPGGKVTTFAGVVGSPGSADGMGSAARFTSLIGLAVDSTDHIIVADTYNNRIRKVTPSGEVSTLEVGGAQFDRPSGVALDAAGNIFVADRFNHTIRKVTPAGVVTTVAGLAGSVGSADGTGGAARFNYPSGVAVDGAGNIFVADTFNNAIRKITSTGVVTTFAGLAGMGNNGSTDGIGSAARLYHPFGVAVDRAGSVYVADSDNQTIRKVTPAGVVTTLGGQSGNVGSEDGTGSSARFYEPAGVAVDGAENIFVVDYSSHNLRKGIPDYGQPIIYGQPQSQTVSESATVALSVASFGASPLAYQWLFSGTNLAGATSNTLNIASFQAANAGSYFVVVSNVYGTATSVVAVLSLPAVTNQPPSVAITSPTEGARFIAPAGIALSASATDGEGAVTNVSFFAGTILLGRVTNAPFNFTWTNAPVNGHSLTAVATDNGGLSATSAPVSITVQTAVPEIFMTSPTNGNSFVAPANILLKASATDGDSSVAWVDFFNGTNLIGSVTNPSPPTVYQFTWSGVGNGSYLLSAVVHDSYGPVVTSSPPVSVSVGTLATNVPVFYWSNLTASVGEAGGALTLHVLKNASSLAANIAVSTRDGSATAGGGTPDYGAAVSNLIFAAGETVKAITISILQDALNESNQFFFVTLSPPTAGSITGGNEATVTIVDDDAPGTNSFLGQSPPGLPPSPLGNLRVNLSPSNILPQWKLAWDLDWRNGGTILRGLTPGNYEVLFKPVAGFIEPLSTVVPVAGGVTNDFFFTYSNSPGSQIGSLRVVIDPPLLATAVNTNARGQWKRQGEPSWHDSGEQIDGLAAGSYTIEFKTVSDPAWTAPGAQVISVPANALAEVTGNYYVANTSPGEGPRLLDFESEIKLGLAPPYAFVGQLRTPRGWGSGTVVKERVVLTAAHVVFDDHELAFVPDASVQWFFQRHAGVYEPAPQTPRGAVVMGGYAAQRAASGPGVSTPAAQELDAAALYFNEPAGRGGFSGYLVSTNDELINAALFGTIVGYPVEGVPASERGQMHATPIKRILWQTALAPHVFATTNVKAFPGNSGGPLCIPSTNGLWFPAAVFLGGSGNTVARVIDSAAAQLIIDAERAANDINNNSGGEPPGQPCLSCPPSGIYAYLDIYLVPTNIGTLGGGYRFLNTTNGTVHRDGFTRYQVIGNVTNWTLEFLAADQHIKPPTVTLGARTGTTNRVVATYKPWGRLDALGAGLLRLPGASGVTYRIDFKPTLNASVWTPVKTQTLTSASATLVPTTLVPGATNGFFRAVLLP